MSTTFAIFRIPVITDEYGNIESEYTADDYAEVAFRSSRGISWSSPFSKMDFALKDSVPVYPLDNTAQGIFTIGDIKKQIKKQLKGGKEKKPKPTRVLHPSFMVWLSLWPKDDEFVDGTGRKHEKNRVFSCSGAVRDRCERKFVAYLKEYSEEQLWNALRAELNWRKEKSTKTGRNELQFMNGPEPYLNQKKFESWLNVESKNETVSVNKLVDPTDVF